jgi:hypothetical protein
MSQLSLAHMLDWIILDLFSVDSHLHSSTFNRTIVHIMVFTSLIMYFNCTHTIDDTSTRFIMPFDCLPLPVDHLWCSHVLHRKKAYRLSFQRWIDPVWFILSCSVHLWQSNNVVLSCTTSNWTIVIIWIVAHTCVNYHNDRQSHTSFQERTCSIVIRYQIIYSLYNIVNYLTAQSRKYFTCRQTEMTSNYVVNIHTCLQSIDAFIWHDHYSSMWLSMSFVCFSHAPRNEWYNVNLSRLIELQCEQYEWTGRRYNHVQHNKRFLSCHVKKQIKCWLMAVSVLPRQSWIDSSIFLKSRGWGCHSLSTGHVMFTLSYMTMNNLDLDRILLFVDRRSYRQIWLSRPVHRLITDHMSNVWIVHVFIRHYSHSLSTYKIMCRLFHLISFALLDALW